MSIPRRLLVSHLLLAIFTLVIAWLSWRDETGSKLAVFQVMGGSMGERLCGDHFDVTCEDCGFEFSCDADAPPSSRRVVCPNCGHVANRLTAAQHKPGDVVTVDKRAFVARGPRRWEVVALRVHENEATKQVVKRIVGLPGEQISIHHGDLFDRDQILRKSLDQLRSVAQLVHDSQHATHLDPSLPPRWRGATEQSRWRRREGKFVLEGTRRNPAGSTNDEVEWLVYHHWNCFATPVARTAEQPIRDHYGYNQSASRTLNAVTDVLLSAQIKAGNWKRLTFRIHDGREWFTVFSDSDRREIVLLRGNKQIARRDGAIASNDVSQDVEIAVCDQRVMFAINGKQQLKVDYAPLAKPLEPTAAALGVGVVGDRLVIERLRVFRDLYYLPANRDEPDENGGADENFEVPLGPDQYLVLGDNAPLSVDSRHWNVSHVSRKSLVGKVLMPPSRAMDPAQ